MAIGVDTSKWKPRKLSGTPSARAVNIVGFGILSVGVVCGVIYHFFGVTEKLKKTTEKIYEDPVEEVERKILIAAGLPNRTGETLRKMIEEEQRPDLPYK